MLSILTRFLHACASDNRQSATPNPCRMHSPPEPILEIEVRCLQRPDTTPLINLLSLRAELGPWSKAASHKECQSARADDGRDSQGEDPRIARHRDGAHV